MTQEEFDNIPDLRLLLSNGKRDYTNECLHYLGDKMQLAYEVSKMKAKFTHPPYNLKVLLKYNENWQVGSYVYNKVYRIYDKDDKAFQFITKEKLEWEFLPFENWEDFRNFFDFIIYNG